MPGVKCRAVSGLAVLLSCGLAACGGGGSSSPPPGGSTPPPSVAPIAGQYSASASVTGQTPVPIQIPVTFQNEVPGTTYYVGAKYTTNAITSMVAQAHGGASYTVYASLKPPYSLKPGVYTDQVIFGACLDPTCTSILTGSESAPLTLTYTITAVTGAQAPTAELASTSVTTQALTTDPTPPATSNDALTLTNFNSVTPVVIVTSTKNGLGAVGYSPTNLYNGGLVQIVARPGATVGPGNYNDTVTVTVCLDPACLNPVGSPFKIAVQYTVTDTVTVAGTNGYTFGIVALQSADIAWDATHSLLYLSTPPDLTNALGAIRTLDPATIKLGVPVPIGHQPAALAVSDDGAYLYAGLADVNSAARLTLPALAPDITIPLAPYQSLSQFALDIEVAPGFPHTIALTRTQALIGNTATAPVQVFDDAVPRTNAGAIVSFVQWGPGATSLYGLTNNLNPNNLYTFNIDATGIAGTTAVTGNTTDTRIHLDQGLIYADGGFITDPTSGTLVHQLPNNVHQVLPDSPHGKIFACAAPVNGMVIQSYDNKTYAPIASVPLPSYTNNCVRLIRWGSSGLALTTDSGYVVLVSGAFVGP
jgi:hypothetical protein